MIHNASKAFFHLLAHIGVLKKLASRYGMRRPASFARRFIAGETVAEAMQAARAVEQRGFLHTLDYLGESVKTLAEADKATQEYLRIIDAVVAAGIGRNLSLKLTQLGLDVDRASAVDNLRKILDRAEGFFVRIDMESSRYTDVTLDTFETLWHHGYHQMGVVLQSDLHRTEQDAARIIALGARIRLVKGAYKESKAMAYQNKADVDAAFVRLMKRLLAEGTYPAIATHDPAMIEQARRFATERGIAPDRFEFQMLYGIRRDLQSTLLRDGHRVRIYIPFGCDWFPYFMRRLGERPANISFVLRGIVGERT
jgi:proline dehydrogenase